MRVMIQTEPCVTNWTNYTISNNVSLEEGDIFILANGTYLVIEHLSYREGALYINTRKPRFIQAKQTYKD